LAIAFLALIDGPRKPDMKIPILQGIEEAVRRLRCHILRNDIRRAVRARFDALEGEGYIFIRPAGDHRIALSPSDKVIGASLLSGGDWFRAETTWAIEFLAGRNLMPPGSVFVDVGANIGTQSVYAMLSGRFDRVLALEPASAQFDLLRLNAFLSNFQERIACRQVAAGACSETLALVLNPTNQGDNWLSRDARPEVEKVPVEPLDAILKAENILPTEIGLVWIDVQGHELAVSAGMSSVLHASVPLVVEFNSDRYGPEGTLRFIQLLEQHYDRFIDLTAADRTTRCLDHLNHVRAGADVLVYREGDGRT
jgi:FkbM family methyltransferase